MPCSTEVAGQHRHGVGCGSDTDPAVFAFGTAAFQVAVWIGLVGGLAGACGSDLESHPGDAGSFELLVDVAAFSGQGVGFRSPPLRRRVRSTPRAELGIGVGQLKPQCLRRIEAPRRSGG